MDSTRKQPSLYSPLGRSSRAGEQGGSHYSHTNEGKQIHSSSSSSSNQEELATFHGRIKAIANQLSPADASFIEGVFSCMDSKGGDMLCGI
jgi:hypothetical protein